MHKLRNVILVVNAFTDCVCAPVDPRIWKLCRKNNPSLRIHLLSEGKRTKKEVVFQVFIIINTFLKTDVPKKLDHFMTEEVIFSDS